MPPSWKERAAADLSALLQEGMDPKQRRELGAHYTSEAHILRTLEPLFLDQLRSDLDAARGSSRALRELLARLHRIRILDPACGAGDFLVVALRELRRLELEVLLALGDPHLAPQVGAHQLLGIELDPQPARVARVALEHTAHQEDLRASQALARPLPHRQGTPTIVCGNALAMDWAELVPPDELSYIVSNPPFLGKKEQNKQQKADMKAVFGDARGAGTLDYVAAWYLTAAQLMEVNPKLRAAYVSTSSITQGEQVRPLWSLLYDRGVDIRSAHRTFEWTSEARDKAAVHCVIIGFDRQESGPRWLFEYDTPRSEPQARRVRSINAYLVEGGRVLLGSRRQPLHADVRVSYGSFALDDGNFTLSQEDRDALVRSCPGAEPFIRPFVGGQELLHGNRRYCLWLQEAEPAEVRALPPVLERVERVRKWRSASKRATTVRLAATPALFAEVRQPTQRYLAIPTVSSERRVYIPMAFLPPTTIASNQVYVFAGASLFHFGILTSSLHMTWVRAVCGRLESRYRYSASIVYNNFPWPEASPKKRARIEEVAQQVLDVRAGHDSSTLADLYDARTMPADLVEAHRALDRAVDKAYGIGPGRTEAERVAHLLAMHPEASG